jgi:hypothetical protein
MAHFSMRRIPAPPWAIQPDVRLYEMQLSVYRAIQDYRGRILEVVQNEVEAYLNEPGLYFEGEGFPDRSRLTGEYYLGDESYKQHVNPLWIQIGIMCRCLSQRETFDHDYLGLEVWLRCDPMD